MESKDHPLVDALPLGDALGNDQANSGASIEAVARQRLRVVGDRDEPASQARDAPAQGWPATPRQPAPAVAAVDASTLLNGSGPAPAPARLGQAARVRVSVVIPALNEAPNLPHAFANLPADVHEVVLVDGHSTDETVRVAKRLRPDVRIVMQSAQGKGDALAAGFAKCTGDIIVSMDADGSTNAAEIPRFVQALLNGADYVKGSRYLPEGGSADLTRIRSLGNRVLGQLVNLLYRTRYTDLCYGYNAFWSRHLPHVLPDRDGFEVETLMNIRAAKNGLVVREVPSYEQRRVHGVSKLNALSDGWRVLATILSELFRPPSRPRMASDQGAGR